jgi:hypothetical protein
LRAWVETATYEDPLYQLLRDGKIKEFNQRKSQGDTAS